MDRNIVLADGRTVGFADFGPPDGVPVVMCHGGPGSRLAPSGMAPAAREAGLRLIGIDRPGYGLSTPVPGRTIGSWAADALAVIDHLGAGDFVAVGTSTGGAYALALAAAAPGRVLAAVACCALSDLRWAEGKAMASVNRMGEMFDADRETALRIAAEVLGVDGSRIATAMDNVGLAPADAALVADPAFATRWAAEMPEMFRQGVAGYADDRLADGKGWGSVDLAAIRCPVYILHGEADSGIPVAHARHTASLIPAAKLRLYPHHGHFSISTEILPLLREIVRR